MKTLTHYCLIILLCFAFVSQSFASSTNDESPLLSGEWQGELDVNGQKLALIFHLEKHKGLNTFTASMDSPAQGAFGIPIKSVTLLNSMVSINISAAGATYEGNLDSKKLIITGAWKQGLNELPLVLKRVDKSRLSKVAVPNRPQHPVAPYDYNIENVLIHNKNASIDLAGTLTTPLGAGKYPAVVLISGSGPQDRDQTFMGHKTFWVIADHLTRNGIAVLRMDDRGVDKSQGIYKDATSIDFASDASAAVDFLRAHNKIKSTMVGLIGHSEGGLVAPITYDMNDKVAFIVMLAGPGKNGHDIAITQVQSVLEVNGLSQQSAIAGSRITAKLNQTVMNNHNTANLEAELHTTYKSAWDNTPPSAQDELRAIGGGQLSPARLQQLRSAWTKTFLLHNPSDYLQKLKVPVLALHGNKDTQMRADQNIVLIRKALAKEGHALNKIEIVDGVNHLFQTADTGAMHEYAQISETISIKVLDTVTDCVNTVVKD